MRLKKLELFGFKSFADKTTIIFDQGVTCIVGPNGCGKSNISDSIRWVLGERSPKVLRGSKMEDVIFNGTDFRKALGYTEVSLTLDNSDRTLPIEYQEVTITRRLHRSGESEYLINKTTCRLKDIQDLILDTGLGSSSYSMIEQGKIDHILNANPEERRFLIEEAAGISKYEAKKDEAIRKLERTEENRLRLNDILHEVQKNIQYAERQAKRAQKYRENYEKLKDLEIRKAFYDIENLKTTSEKINAEETAHQNDLTQMGEELDKLRTEQSQLNEVLRGILDRYSGEDSKRHQIQSKIEQNEQTLRFHQEKLVEIASRRGQMEQEMIQLHERIEKYLKEKSEKETTITSLRDEKEHATESLSKCEAQMKEIETQAAETRKLLEQIKSETFRIAMQMSQFRNDFHKTTAFLETADEREKKDQQTAGRLEKEIETWKNKQDSFKVDLTTLKSRSETSQLKKNVLVTQIEQEKTALDADRFHLQKYDREIHELETQLKILIEVNTQAEMTERTILDHLEGPSASLVESLRDVFEARPGFEWALEAALDSFSKSLVVENFETAKKLLEQIKIKKPSWMSFLVKGEVSTEIITENQTSSAPQHPAIECALKDAVQIRSGFEKATLPLLENVFITREITSAENLEELYGLSDQYKFVFPDGVILGPQRKIAFRQSDSHSESGIFQRASEIKTIESSLKQKHIEHMNALIALKNRELELQELEVQKEECESEILDQTIQKESFESHHQSIDERLHSIQKERQIILIESEEFQMQRRETIALKEKLHQKIQELETEEKKVRETQEDLIRSLEQIDTEKSTALKELTESRVRFRHFEEQFRLLDEALKMLDTHEKDDQRRLAQIKEESATLIQKEQTIKEEDTTIRLEQSERDKERRESEIALELIRREKESAEQALTASREVFESFQQKTRELEQNLHQLAMKKMDLGYQEKNIHERLTQLYKLQLSDYSAELFRIEGDIEVIQKTVEDLRGKIDSIGTVNLLAIEEYDELKQRHDFLQTQMKDLEDAREALLETIRQINRTTKSLFEQTFAEVQKMFQEYYQTLFRGGQAKLVLTDESNPLESGIDIVVRPPGKKLQHITLLSGGEKALTAIALLCALFRIKPSPFCVLDEVDAPLDEANVDRFINVLQSFLKLSQFIIVTHNRKTIAMGNALYGVTMQEAGISKLVSVKVNRDQQPSAAADDQPTETAAPADQTAEQSAPGATENPSKSIEEQLQS